MNYKDGNVNDSVMVVPRYSIVPSVIIRSRIEAILLKNQPSCYNIYNSILEKLGGNPLKFSNITKFSAGDIVYPDSDYCVIDFDYNSEPIGNYCNYEMTILLKILLLDRENRDVGSLLSLGYLESWLMVFQTIKPMDLIIRDMKENESYGEYMDYKTRVKRVIGDIDITTHLFQKGGEYVAGAKGLQSVLKLDLKGKTLGNL